MTAMLNNEFPRLIYVNSVERTKVERNFPILDETKTMKPLLFEYFLEFDKLVDCFPHNEEFLVNHKYSLGEPIDSTRVNIYEDSLLEGSLNLSQVNVIFSTIE
jgi:hypothetical protein